ncbi:MAG: VOC family protein [Nitrososphaerota archaeon]|nr:VOC family protein [Nitrososphaerota archaeon]
MRLHHIGLATNNIDESIRNHKSLFNFEPVSDIVADEQNKVKVVLLSDSRSIGPAIELVCPLGEDSPISNLLKRGFNLYHLCFVVGNLELSLEKAQKSGAKKVFGPSQAKLYDGKRIAFVYTKDRYLVEFLEDPSENNSEDVVASSVS